MSQRYLQLLLPLLFFWPRARADAPSSDRPVAWHKMWDVGSLPRVLARQPHRHLLADITEEAPVSLSDGGGPTCYTAENKAWCWNEPLPAAAIEDWLEAALDSNAGNPTAPLVVPNTTTPDPEATVPEGLVTNALFARLEGSWLKVSRSIEHLCGIKTDGKIACSGRGESGQIGNGQFSDQDTPVETSSLERFTSVTVGNRHSCALADSGKVYCWGANDWGQLGDNSQKSQSVPTEVYGNATTWQAISAGYQFTCGLQPGPDAFSELYCWGRNTEGQLGNGSIGAQFLEVTPTAVAGQYFWHVVSSGYSTACGILESRHALCWGSNNKGMLGVNSTIASSPVPIKLYGNQTWEKIAVGRAHACGLQTNGALRCWGFNYYGQLGSGNKLDSSIPISVVGNNTWTDITVGPMHSCGVRANGTVACWGYSRFGGSPIPVTITLPDSEDGSSNDTAIIVGVVVGVGVGVAAVIGGLWYVVQKKRKRHRPVVVPAISTVDSHTKVADDDLHVRIDSGEEKFGAVVLTPLPSSTPQSGSLTSSTVDSVIASYVSKGKPPFTMGSSGQRAGTGSTLGSGSGALSPRVVLTRKSISLGSGELAENETPPWQFAFEEMKVKDLLGTGSFGKVYLAVWHETDVALKVLAEGKQGIHIPLDILHEKLVQEAVLMAQLRHPNCVQFLGFCDEPTPCIASEYCSRGSLYNLLQSASCSPAAARDLPWKRRVKMALDAAKGMLYLHTRKPAIVHRDLKSPNLLVTNDWTVKVADFNLSKLVAETEFTGSAEFVNNPRWCAPEVMEGKTATPASDVFSFGVVMWELLTWETPWANEAHFLVGNQVLAGNRLIVPALADLPGSNMKSAKGVEGFIELMHQCWAQNPADRPNFQDIIIKLRELV